MSAGKAPQGGGGRSSHEEDAAIVAAVLAGDVDAYAQLVERYQQRVYLILLRMVGTAYDAEELAQETFFKVYFALPTYKPEYRFSSWLFRIATNLGVSFLRRRGRTTSFRAPDPEEEPSPTPRVEDPDEGARPAQATAREDLCERLWKAVAALPDDFRDIILLRHVEELSYQEICDVTGLSMGTVKSRLARARQRLGGMLGGTV